MIYRKKFTQNDNNYEIQGKTYVYQGELKVRVTIYQFELFLKTKVYERSFTHEYLELCVKIAMDSYFKIDEKVKAYMKQNKLVDLY